MKSEFARRAYGSFGRLGPGQRIAGYFAVDGHYNCSSTAPATSSTAPAAG